MKDRSVENEDLFKPFNNRLRIRVSGICLNAHDEILLIRHRYPGKKPYLIAPPGGEMHFGEHAHNALKREYKEETGLEIEVGQLLFVHEFNQGKLHAIELFFKVFSLDTHQLHLGTDPELKPEEQIIVNIEWMNIDSIQSRSKECLHHCLRNLNHVSDIEKRKGYSSEIY